MDLLEVHVLERRDRPWLPDDVRAQHAQAIALHARWEATNERVVQRLRRRIAAGRTTAAGLARALTSFTGPRSRPGDYDALDLLVAQLLDAGDLADEQRVREPEMVFYQPTPAWAVLDFITRAEIQPHEVVYDLGSGLGHVVMLVALLTCARVRGVELEPSFCDFARRSAALLNLRRVDFVEADAREAPLDDGDVFFMYTPFRGAMLAQVLGRLQAVARQRPIRVGTYGPCTAEVAAIAGGWLHHTADEPLDEYAVAVFHAGPTP